MSGTFLALIAERVINQPLMILPEKLAVIAQVLEGRISIDASDLKVDAEHHIAVQASRYAGEYRPVSPGSKNLKPYRETAGGTADPGDGIARQPRRLPAVALRHHLLRGDQASGFGGGRRS
jgi:hypothetical protein